MSESVRRTTNASRTEKELFSTGFNNMEHFVCEICILSDFKAASERLWMLVFVWIL